MKAACTIIVKMDCKTCEGTGKVAQLDGQIGGDIIPSTHQLYESTQFKMDCPRCNGTSKINLEDIDDAAFDGAAKAILPNLRDFFNK